MCIRDRSAKETEGSSASSKVKHFTSNLITIFLWFLVVLTIIAAVVAGLQLIACAIPSSSALSQMNSAHLEVPISHYEAIPLDNLDTVQSD